MTWNHERVEELLAANALGGLEGEDAELAERALVEHVPDCSRCLRAAEAYRRVAGDLALLATPIDPPDTLARRLRRSIGRRRSVRAGRSGWAAAAVVAAAAVALAAWNMSLVGRLNRAEIRQGWLIGALSTATRSEEAAMPLSGSGPMQVSLVSEPGERRLYVIATRIPAAEGVYRVWFLGGGRSWSPGTLEPEDGGGGAMLPVETELEDWEIVMVTREADDEGPTPQGSPLVSATVDP